MDGRELDVVDISATGIQVRHAPGWVVAGQGLYFDLLIPVRKGMKKVQATGHVLRRKAQTWWSLITAPIQIGVV